MNDLELMRLYLLYKAGSVQDGKKNSDLLKAAKATASDLTEDEFAWLNKEIENLQSIRDSQAKGQRDTAGAINLGDKKWNIWQSAKSFAMGSSDYQKRLWELPDLVRSDKPFAPTRLADGNPIDLDPNDAEGSQERLKAQPYSQVKHDPKLRDAWHAAQSGKFADMLKGKNFIDAENEARELTKDWDGVVTPPKTTPVASAPLRNLLESMRGGESPTSSAPALSPDSIRYYHGTTADDSSSFSGKTFLSPHESYARNYGSGNKNVLYTDFSKEEAISRGLYDTENNFPINGPIDDGKDRLKKLISARDFPKEARKHASELVAPPIQMPRAANGSELVAPPIQMPRAANGSELVAPPIDLGKTARQNAASLTQGIIEDPTNLPRAGKSMLSRGLDALQTGLDAIGVADPTPIADGINAGISLVRAFTEPENAGTHVSNAAISAVGMVPYIGDFAKLAKYGRKGANAAGYAATQGPNTGAFGSSGNSGGAIPPTPNGTGTPGPGPSGENPSNSGNSGVSGNITANWILPAIAAAQKQLQPDQYSGNQFDSATSTVDRFQSAVDVFVPKWSSLGVAISSVSSAFNSWLAWFKKIESAGDRMLEQNKMLAQYNGNLAGSYAELDQGRFNREVQRSDENGGALGRLANEQNRFEDTRQKLFGPLETLQINVQTHLTRFSNNLLTLIDNNEQITELLRDAQQDNKAKAEARNALEFSMWERGLVQNAKIPNKLNRK